MIKKSAILLLLILIPALVRAEGLTTGARTTLNGNITSAATTLVVASSTGFPSPPFRIRIDNELILVGAVAGTTWSNLTRNVEQIAGAGAAASHTSGVAVTHVLTANGIYSEGNTQIFYVGAYPNTLNGVTYPDAAHAAQSLCPTSFWTSGSKAIGNFTAVTDSNHNLEYATLTGCSGGGATVSPANPPTWPSSGTVGSFPNNTQTGACSTSGTGTITWHSAGWGITQSNDCTLVFLPGSYTLAQPLIFGVGGSSSGAAAVQTYPGASITATSTMNSTHGTHGAGFVVGNHGTVTGESDMTGGVIGPGSGATLDAVVETWSGYANTNLGVNVTTPNNSVRNITINGGATIGKALLWASSVEGQADYSNLYVNASGNGQTGILVDGVGGQYNADNFYNVWIVGNHGNQNGTGMDIECSGNGQQSPSINIFGGVIDDFGPGTTTYLKVNGTCRGTNDYGTYFETSNETNLGVTGISLNNVIGFNGYGLIFNGGGGVNYSNAVSITGTSDLIHVDGLCGICTGGNRISNTISGYASGGNGNFNYTYSNTASGAPVFDSNTTAPVILEAGATANGLGTFTAGINFGGSFTVNNLLLSDAAPTISSGFCSTGPSIAQNNGTAAFQINVGTSCSTNTGAVGLPPASHGWSCNCQNMSTAGNFVRQTGSTASSCTLTQYSTGTTAANFTASDKLNCSAVAF